MSTHDEEGLSPEAQNALDELYEAMAEVEMHRDQSGQDLKDSLARIEAMQKDLLAQRQAAAQAGERATYDQLSDQLAQLTRAYQAASEDPDEDPLGTVPMTDAEPTDHPPTTPEENT